MVLILYAAMFGDGGRLSLDPVYGAIILLVGKMSGMYNVAYVG